MDYEKIVKEFKDSLERLITTIDELNETLKIINANQDRIAEKFEK